MLIQTTFSTQEEASSLAQKLLDKKLVACVQYTLIKSEYIWKGEIAQESEILASFKTAQKHYPKIETLILKHHPYETPEIIGLPIKKVQKAYKKWLKNALTQ